MSENEDDFIDPELEQMSRQFRLEREEELSELEEIEGEAREHQIDLSFALLELLWRGDNIRAQVFDKTFAGEVVHVGEDLVTIRTQAGTEIDCNLAHLISVTIVERVKQGGRAKISKDPGRFVARLRELADYAMQEVECGGPQLAVTGKITRVHNDHIYVTARDKKEWLIPLASLAYVVRADRGR